MRPDPFHSSQGCQHTGVRAGGPQTTCRDRPAGWQDEGPSGTLGLTFHIPRAGVDGRAEKGASQGAARSAHSPASKEQSPGQEQVRTGAPVSHRQISSIASASYPSTSVTLAYKPSVAPYGQRDKSKLQGEAKIFQPTFSLLSLSHGELG